MHRPNPFNSVTLFRSPSLISRSPLRRCFPVVLLGLGLFVFSAAARAVDPPQTEAIPGTTLLRVIMRFSALQPAAATRPLESKRAAIQHHGQLQQQIGK